MSITNCRNDPERLKKEAEISSYSGRYYLVVPGQGRDLPYIEDPHLRLEKWGANTMTHIMSVENDLKGINRPLNRDFLNVNEYTNYTPSFAQRKTHKILNHCITEESRSICPAFTLRGIEIPRWEEPFLNPQANFELAFRSNIQTRILEKDKVYDTPMKEYEFMPSYWLPQFSNDVK